MTLQERLRDPAHGFDRNDSHTEDRYVCLCEHLANEAADALDAQAERIKELIAALEYWLPDEAELDKYSREAQDAWSKHIDILQRAREALKDKP